MKRFLVLLAVVSAGAIVPSAATAASPADRYIVVLDNGANAASVAGNLGLDPGHVYSHALDASRPR